MTDMLETKKYTFTVEGETERWYLLWLRDRINEQEGKEDKGSAASYEVCQRRQCNIDAGGNTYL